MSFGSDDHQNPFASKENAQNPYAAPSQASMEGAGPLPQDGGGAPLATRGERFAGALIDFFVIVPLMVVAVIAMSFALVSAGIEQRWVYEVIGTVIFVGIYLLINGYLLASKGQTVGKLVMKTQIVSDTTETILPFGPLMLKRYVPIWLIAVIPIVGDVFGIVNVLAIFRQNRKCVHDEFAGTKVIKLPA